MTGAANDELEEFKTHEMRVNMESEESMGPPALVQQSKSSCDQRNAQLVAVEGAAISSLSFVNSKSRNEENSLKAGGAGLSSNNRSASS